METPHSTLKDDCVEAVEELKEKEDWEEKEKNRQAATDPVDIDPVDPIQTLANQHGGNIDTTCFVFPTPWVEKPPPRPQPFVDALKDTTFGCQLARWTGRCLDALDLGILRLGGGDEGKIMFDILKDARTRRGPSNRAGLLVHKTSASASPPSRPPLHIVYTARVHACRHPDSLYGRLAAYLMADDTWQPAITSLQDAKFCWPDGHQKGTPFDIATQTAITVSTCVARTAAREVACLGAGDACILSGLRRPSALAFDPRQRWQDPKVEAAEEAQMDLLQDMVWAQVGDEASQRVGRLAEQQVREALKTLDIDTKAATEADGGLTISLDADLHAVCDHPGHRVGGGRGEVDLDPRKCGDLKEKQNGDSDIVHDNGLRVVTIDTAATTDIPSMISRQEETNKNMENRMRDQKQGQEKELSDRPDRHPARRNRQRYRLQDHQMVLDNSLRLKIR